ncbi:MAG: D-alanyl-D-alanine carboxypeptidase family protein [Chloracidobacterium sp.]|nr:D-alanyl-D-alanine carboxypeptidase family protein [Chloracidobacterium sp.]
MHRSIIALITLAFAVGACQCGSETNDNKTWTNIPKASNSGKNSAIEPDKNIMNGGFTANLPAGFEPPTDEVGKRMLKEYGALYVARGGAVAPKTAAFRDGAAVTAFQSSAKGTSGSIGGTTLELQEPAMTHLKDAIAEAEKSGASITPRGTDSAKRSYEDTVTLWASRVNPGLTHWVGKGRITQADADRIKGMSPFEQVSEIFKLEEQGIYFAKTLDKSIIYSVAPPGTSQHLSMLALDVNEHENAKVRQILAKHGWYQTVVSDLPHFTFLGVPESDLPRLGLKKRTDGGRIYWVPDI